MKFYIAACVLFALSGLIRAQDKPALASEPNSVTVPAAIDHNRVVINADLALPNGSTERVRAWVDNGNPDLNVSRRLATLLGLAVSCNDHECSSPPPPEMIIGGMKIDLTGVRQVKIPLKPVNAASVLAAGMTPAQAQTRSEPRFRVFVVDAVPVIGAGAEAELAVEQIALAFCLN